MVSTVFAPLVGQPQAVELLTQAILHDRIAPAYLFVGPKGVGRSLAAECFLSGLFSGPIDSRSLDTDDADQVIEQSRIRTRIQQRNHPDLLWVEPTYLHQGKMVTAAQSLELGIKRKTAPQIRLEQIREVARFLSRPSLEASRSVVVLEQTETMAEAAANGLLKTLEEPGNATLILMAPNTNALLPTLISRCQGIPFYRLSHLDVERILTQSGHAEILAKPEILSIAQGSPGMAIASWHQLQNLPMEILDQISIPPQSLRGALALARQIAKTLDLESQLWLLDYLQHCYWQQNPAVSMADSLNRLEQARLQLLKYVQPRLVWEVMLMGIRSDGIGLQSEAQSSTAQSSTRK